MLRNALQLWWEYHSMICIFADQCWPGVWAARKVYRISALIISILSVIVPVADSGERSSNYESPRSCTTGGPSLRSSCSESCGICRSCVRLLRQDVPPSGEDHPRHRVQAVREEGQHSHLLDSLRLPWLLQCMYITISFHVLFDLHSKEWLCVLYQFLMLLYKFYIAGLRWLLPAGVHSNYDSGEGIDLASGNAKSKICE